MSNANLILKKVKDRNRIEITRNNGDILGTVLPDGTFVAGYQIEIYPAELRSIMAVSENFQMIYDNLK